MSFLEWWNKYGNFIVGISILIFVVVGWTAMYQDVQRKKAIEENCGWGDEDYYCYCEKSAASEIKNKLESGGIDLGDLNISYDS